MDKPTIHITNWSSRKLRGPGKKWSIMAAPRLFELGDGQCNILVPRLGDMRAAKSGLLPMSEYRRRYIAGIDAMGLEPGNLSAERDMATVADGDTLCCACSRKAAAMGECHRVWAAELLRLAGWRVVLDGQELAGTTDEGVPYFWVEDVVGDAPAT